MISFLRGTVFDTTEDSVILDVHGVGYTVNMAMNDLVKLSILQGEVTVHTYFAISENGIALYGFLSKESMAMFKLLISVSGVGPKSALSMLNSYTPDDIIYAIMSEDQKLLSKANGIGPKAAGRIIVDLKDKVSVGMFNDNGLASTGKNNVTAPVNENAVAIQEATEALTSLGFSPSEAIRSVQSVEAPSGATGEELLKLALKKMH